MGKLASMIAMITVGCVLIPICVFYEVKFAARPVVAKRLVFNHCVGISCLAGAFDFVRSIPFTGPLVMMEN